MALSSTQPSAFFLRADAGRNGQRYCRFYSAHGELPRGSVLYIHPFAEEMNKSRRMAALQSRALAQAGYTVMQIDLLGCGDSSGDFGEARWQDWVADVVQATQCLRMRSAAHAGFSEQQPLWLWGLRAGCLLAAEAASQIAEPSNLLFWQPPASGAVLLQQFLRLKIAGEMSGNTSKNMMAKLRAQLSDGSAVEVAGYSLGAALASGLDSARAMPPSRASTPSAARRLELLEISSRPDAPLSPAGATVMSHFSAAGHAARSRVIVGPAFWQTSEIAQAPDLLAATVAALADSP